MSKTQFILSVTVLTVFVLGGITGYFVRDYRLKNSGKPVVQQREFGYAFINPLLECDTTKDFLANDQLVPFKNDVEEFIANKLNKTWARNVSVYFRELHDGLWFSIGDTDQFTPASLLKIPLMIAYFKMAEQDKSILNRKLRFTGTKDQTSYQVIKPAKSLQPQHEYTVDDLIYRSIVYSDNNAADLLRRNVNVGVLFKTYRDLGMNDPDIEWKDDDMSVVSYSSFFRVLYNSSYLTRGMSEKALQYLSESDFRSGLVAGVPAGIRVAHKFGERSYQNTDEVQLHDCGIVYYPQHPYLLCVMSRGNNYEYLDDTIAAISRLVFTRIDAQHNPASVHSR